MLLEAVNLSKSYRKIKAVDALSFQVQKGQVFGLIGSNGAGKSTTVSMIATLRKPDSGKLLFRDRDVWEKPSVIREMTGYVPQDIALYESLSGMDNLRFWGRASHIYGARLKERIRAVSDIIGFTDKMLRQKVREYSGGMKRRLNIAVALLKSPELIILDEPTVGVDLVSRNMILDAIRMLADEGAAVVYVGHSMEEVERICDWICMMHQGRAVLNQPLEEALWTKDGKITLGQLYEKTLMEQSSVP